MQKKSTKSAAFASPSPDVDRSPLKSSHTSSTANDCFLSHKVIFLREEKYFWVRLVHTFHVFVAHLARLGLGVCIDLSKMEKSSFHSIAGISKKSTILNNWRFETYFVFFPVVEFFSQMKWKCNWILKGLAFS